MWQYVSLCHKIDPRIKIQSSCVSFSLEYLLSLFPTVGPILILYCMVLEHTIISILLIIWLEVRNRAQKLCLRRGLFIGYCMWLDTCWKGKVNVFVLPWDWLLFSCMKNIWFTCYLLTVLMTHVAPSSGLHFWGIHANEVSALQAATILVMVRRIEQKRRVNTNLMMCDLRTFPKCVIFIPI